jgi:Kef-type K+ transport system membrane component KefB/Trk K+ transport system NAD-binding subunit
MAIEVFSNLQINLLFDIAVIIVFATIITFLVRLLKQPLIIGYIIAGIILGPSFLQLIKNEEIIFALSEIGIAFLLFFIGLDMDLKKLKEVGFFSTLGTIIQVAVTFFAGMLIALKFGIDPSTATIIGFIVAFSSTSVVVKMFSDKDEIDTLHGRLALGLLLMQDIIVIFLLSAIVSLETFSITALTFSFFKGIALFIIALFMSGRVFPRLFGAAATHRELILLLSLTICFIFSTFAAYFGFSIAVGAFIAGISIAPLKYSLNVQGMVAPLKDFFSTIFFVSLGLQLKFGQATEKLMPLLWALLALVIIAKPLIILVTALIFGYEKRSSSKAAFALGQVSEFSLIIAAVALSVGLIASEIFSLTVLMVAFSIIATTYIMVIEKNIYSRISWLLNFISRFVPESRKQKKIIPRKKDIVIFGCHRMGTIFLESFKKLKKKVLVVDHNPDTISNLERIKTDCIYGDVANVEVLKEARLDKAEFVVSTIRIVEDNLSLINYMKEIKSKAKIVVVAEHVHQALDLYDAGADYVIIPHIVSGEKASTVIKDLLKGKRKVERLKNDHIKHILFMERFGQQIKE